MFKGYLKKFKAIFDQNALYAKNITFPYYDRVFIRNIHKKYNQQHAKYKLGKVLTYIK
jgi:hypothetical protein